MPRVPRWHHGAVVVRVNQGTADGGGRETDGAELRARSIVWRVPASRSGRWRHA